MAMDVIHDKRRMLIVANPVVEPSGHRVGFAGC